MTEEAKRVCDCLKMCADHETCIGCMNYEKTFSYDKCRDELMYIAADLIEKLSAERDEWKRRAERRINQNPLISGRARNKFRTRSVQNDAFDKTIQNQVEVMGDESETTQSVE